MSVIAADRRLSHGGGVPSGHCAAAVLVATKDRTSAAQIFEADVMRQS
jgi:hypothetical protein